MTIHLTRPASRRRPTSDPADQAFLLLRTVFTVAPIVFGLDKFANVLTDWPQYLAPWIDRIVPGTAQQAMYVVGVVEILAGVLVAVAPADRRLGGRPPGWPASSSTCSRIPGFYDIALRDFGLFVAAVALGRLAVRRPAPPGRSTRDRPERSPPPRSPRGSGSSAAGPSRPAGRGARRRRPAPRAGQGPRRAAPGRHARAGWPTPTPSCSPRRRSTSPPSRTTRATTSWSWPAPSRCSRCASTTCCRSPASRTSATCPATGSSACRSWPGWSSCSPATCRSRNGSPSRSPTGCRTT